MLNGNKKVPAGFYILNIPLIIIKRKNNYIPQIYVHLELAQSNISVTIFKETKQNSSIYKF